MAKVIFQILEWKLHKLTIFFSLFMYSGQEPKIKHYGHFTVGKLNEEQKLDFSCKRTISVFNSGLLLKLFACVYRRKNIKLTR